MRDAPIVLAGDMNATNFERLWATAGALALDFAGTRNKHGHARSAHCQHAHLDAPCQVSSRTRDGLLPFGRFSDDRMYQMLIGWSDVPTGLTSITTERTVRIDALMYKPKHLEVVRVMPQPAVVGPIPDERHPR